MKQSSVDEEARRLASVRERALRDEATLCHEAEEKGELKGELKSRCETAVT